MKSNREGENMNKEVKVILTLGLISFASLYLQGCGGLELGAKVGAYRVDQKQESQAMHARHTKPLSCLFWSSAACRAPVSRDDDEAMGS